jgi:uncharacterized protein
MTVVDVRAQAVPERIQRDECVRLLSTRPVGRLAVIRGSRPEIFPVNYLMDGDAIVFRTSAGIKFEASVRAPVCFEVDDLDLGEKAGWSVVVHGLAEIITTAERDDVLARLAALPIEVWAPGEKDIVMRIVPLEITGRRVGG